MYYNELLNNLKYEQEFLNNLINACPFNLNECDYTLLKTYYINNGLLILTLNNLSNYYKLDNNGISENLKCEMRCDFLDELIKLSGSLADIETVINRYKISDELLLHLKNNNFENYLDNLNNFIEYEIYNLVN